MAWRVILGAALAGALIGLLAYSQAGREPNRVSGFVEADEVRLGSRVGGRVSVVHVAEGDQVQAGQPLVELEPHDLLVRQKEAQARQAERQAELDQLLAGFRAEEIGQAQARHERLAARLEELLAGPRPQEIEAARAEVQVALAELELAQQHFERTRQLFERMATTSEALDQATQQLRAAQGMRVVREKRLDLLEAGTREEEIRQARAQLAEAEQAWQLARSGYRPEEIQRARSARDAAQAALDAIAVQLSELTVRSPARGTVEALDLQTGDLVAAGAPILSLLDARQLWVRAYVPGRLHAEVGQAVTVTIDELGGRRLAGRISFRARQAEFTPSNVQTPEERSKQVFRIKAEIEGDTAGLWPGMTADVWLDAADG